MVILARQSVETKYLRMTTTDLCHQELFCRGQLRAIIAARELVALLAAPSPRPTAPCQTKPRAGAACPRSLAHPAIVRRWRESGERDLVVLDASDVLNNAFAVK